MKSVVQTDNEKFLSTFERWDLPGQLENFPDKLVPSCVIHIEPKEGRTGYLEGRGKLVKLLWTKLINKERTIEGHRLSWTELVFFSKTMDIKSFKKHILKSIQSSLDSRFKILSVFSLIEGPLDKKIQEIEQMGLQISKVNYWEKHIYNSYFENGIEIKL